MLLLLLLLFIIIAIIIIITNISIYWLQVCQEELTSQDVYVIVNPTNTRLEADSGVSKAIATAGGPSFRDSCNDTIAARSGQMSRGETAVTLLPAGTVCQLKCQCVVHAVLPYRTGKLPSVHCLECKAAAPKPLLQRLDSYKMLWSCVPYCTKPLQSVTI